LAEARMRADFQLTILSLLGVAAVFGILPFAVFRFLTGNMPAAIVDSALVAGIFAVVVHAWRSGYSPRLGAFVTVFALVGAVAAATLLGVAGLFWIYPTLLASFFLVSRRLAVGLTVLAVGSLSVHGAAFATTNETLSFLASAGMLSLFAFTFAARAEGQRRQLERLAGSDALTGVDNRRSMEQELQRAVDSSRRRPDSGFGLLMLDLDHFKQINDRHGHEAGDQVLISFANLIRKSTRATDRLFRFGGEEFVLLLPGTDMAGLRQAGANLRRKIGAGLAGPGGAVTSSLGGALLRPGEDWPAWLARADAALYQAKHKGRDCLVVDDHPTSDDPASVA
jgi:diguanylate cyclase (GGDEF)-like protein